MSTDVQLGRITITADGHRKLDGDPGWSVARLVEEGGSLSVVQALDDAAGQIRRLRAEAEQERRALQIAVDEFEAWKSTLIEDAHREANNHGWCSDFDDFMEAHGMPRRTREYRVRLEREVTMTEYAYVYVTAIDEDEAGELALREVGGADFDEDSYTAEYGQVSVDFVEESD